MKDNYNSANATKINYSETPYNDVELAGEVKKGLVVVKTSEQIIWNNLKNGDEVALGELYDLYVDILFAFGIHHSKDRSYVMDCIHDLFLDLYKYRKRLSSKVNIKFYLIKSLKRKINKKYKVKTVTLDNDFQFSIQLDQKKHAKSIETKIIKKEKNVERNLRLQNALCTLTKKQRQGLYLRFNEDKTYEEISEIMKISVQTARTTTYRAIKVLRKYNLNY